MSWVVDLSKVLTAGTALMMMLSPTPVIYRILKTHSTGHSSIYPLIVTLNNTHAWMLYGYLSENIFPIFSTYIFGETVLLIYVVIYYKFSTERAYAHKLFVIFAVVLTIISSYAALGGYGYTSQTRHDVGTVLGYMGITSSLVMYASPFEKIRQVLKHKSAVFIPIHMTFAACINNVVWIFYSTLTRKWILFAPNTFFLTMGILQFALYCKFHPSTHPYTAPAIVEDTLGVKDLEASPCSAAVVSPSSAEKIDRSSCTASFVAMRSPSEPLHSASVSDTK